MAVSTSTSGPERADLISLGDLDTEDIRGIVDRGVAHARGQRTVVREDLLTQVPA